MYSLCLSMRSRKICTEGQVFAWHPKIEIFMKFSKKCSLLRSFWFWAALPGAQNPDGSSPPRLDILYDSQSLSSSQSNTVCREIVHQLCCQKSVNLGHKLEDFLESVSSFCMGSIFLPRPGHKISRNGFVVSVYALQTNLQASKDFLRDLKIEIFMNI